MGAWGYRNFENDDALDFVGEFRDTPAESLLIESLHSIVEAGGEDYIDSPVAGAALAAAEIVAAAMGSPAPDFPDAVRNVLAGLGAVKNTTLQQLAREAVKRILEDSELQELWAEGGEPNEWQVVQQELLVRLK